MTIREILKKHYTSLLAKCRDTKAINGKTELDLLGDICITAINKFKEKDITEEEGIDYLNKTLASEKFFQYKRIDDTVTYTDNIEGYARNI